MCVVGVIIVVGVVVYVVEEDLVVRCGDVRALASSSGL